MIEATAETAAPPSVPTVDEIKKTVAHDDSAPQALLDFMVSDWAPRADAPGLGAAFRHTRARRRRGALSGAT
jgi:hypothetical protein